MHQKLTIESKIKQYTIEFFSSISQLPKFDNAIYIIDSKIAEIYPHINEKNSILIDCDENAKTIDGVSFLLKQLIIKQAKKNTKLIALGGGVLQDVVGFCASILCRGIDYILIPTTLLSQADSCIGGKTSINFENRKNILGTFYPPSNIFICYEFLKSLAPIEILSGLGEIYKFHILQNKINEFSETLCFDTIYSSLKYKKRILELDEFDKNERQILNFGHTFGHALEASSQHEIPHGIAVIIGSIIAIHVSIALHFNVPHFKTILDIGHSLIKKTNIDFKPEWFDPINLIEITKSDKKNNGTFRMILINDIPIIEQIKDLDIIKKSIIKTYESI
jgi:3-dehydroquinate synthase